MLADVIAMPLADIAITLPLLRHAAITPLRLRYAPDYFTPLSITPFFQLSRHATLPPLFSPPLSLAVTPLSLRFIYVIFIIYRRRCRFDAALISILCHCMPALMPSCHAIIDAAMPPLLMPTLLYDIAMRQLC
jgi:hypothetical protein